MNPRASGTFTGTSFLRSISPLLLIAGISAFFAISSVMTNSRLEESDFRRRIQTLDNTARLGLEIDIAKSYEAAMALTGNEGLIRWFSNDGNAVYRELAIKDLSALTAAGRYDASFAARKDTGELFFGSGQGELLSPDDPDDLWFYEALSMDRPVSLNVDYNQELKRSLLWVNAQVFRGREVIGVAGVGTDIDEIMARLKALIPGKNGQILFVDDSGRVRLAYPMELVGLSLSEVRDGRRRYVNISGPDGASFRYGDVAYSESKMPELGLTAMVQAPVSDFVSADAGSALLFSLFIVLLTVLSVVLFMRVIVKLRNTIQQQNKSQEMTILSMSMLAELKDQETGQHIARTKRYCRLLVHELRKLSRYAPYLTDLYVEDLERSAPLHDIGKVGIPDSILLKPGKLDPAEFEVMKTHTSLGARVLEAAMDRVGIASFFAIGVQLVRHHHEKWDGTGYPYGLSGESIPLSARIMAIADVYDALRSKRPYKDAFSHEAARNIIAEGSGTHFQPELVSAFLILEREFERVSEELSDGDRQA